MSSPAFRIPSRSELEAEALRERALRKIEDELRSASTESLERSLRTGEEHARTAPDGAEWEPTLRVIRAELERRRRRVAS